MEDARPIRGYWTGAAWVLGAYVLLQFMYRIPIRLWHDIASDHAIAPFWFLLVAVYLLVGGRLRRLDVPWIHASWHALHILMFVCVGGILGYRKVFGDIPYGFTSLSRTITEFLISPVLYIILGLLYRAPGS